ncbi:MAG: Fe-S cluster assembly ATPase SufC [Oscillospiraceae bacterium]|nr:Fe-S cluster assembly ATPase SufC [Oscillospiraceae bacterium]
MALLDIKDLVVSAEDKEILHGVSLSVGEGETHVIMGPNGAGKSTLGMAVVGSPEYEKTSGSVLIDGEDVTDESADKIAKKGVFISFQNPVEVPGVTMSSFIKSAMEQITGERIRLWDFKKKLTAAMEALDMDPSYAERDLNVGFSGGEKKKAEILQLLMLRPRLAILDETDSGLDVDAVRTVSAGIDLYRREVGGALLIITHSTRILDNLDVDKVHVIVDGKNACDGGRELVDDINANGFERFIKAGA